MTEFKIEKNVPFTKRAGSKTSKYPWKEMKVGDSILVYPKGKAFSAAVSFRSYINYHRLDWKVATSTEGSESLRIWRIS